MSTSNYALGAQVPLVMYVRDAAGALTNASTTALTITLPDGTTVTPSWTSAATGTYTYDYPTTVPGNHSWVGASTGPATSTDPERFRVRDTLADYATLTDLKSYLGITDTVDDNQLYIALDASQAAIEAYCGRTFGRDTAATARLFDVAYDECLYVDDIASTSGLVVGTSNGNGTYTTLVASTYTTRPLNALTKGRPITQIVGNDWSTGALNAGVQVTAKWGWPSVPPEVTQATLILASRLFKRKNSPEGVAGFGDLGVIRITTQDVDVKTLLAPYVLPGIA